MFHNAHNLDDIVAQTMNPVDNMLFEIFIRVHLRLGSTHPNMALVYLQTVVGPGRVLMFKNVGILNKYSIVAVVFILLSEVYPGWYPVLKRVIGQLDMSFDLGKRFNLLIRDGELPSTEVILQ